MLMYSVLIGAIVVLSIAIIHNYILLMRESKKHNIPVCYHCESKDTIRYHKGVFSCNKCDGVLDGGYLMENWPEDVRHAMLGKEIYRDFKKKRGA